jgi:phosphoglycerol transferase MdoB-like AlkP superfamily enzyme
MISSISTYSRQRVAAISTVSAVFILGWLETGPGGTSVPGPFALFWFAQSHMLTVAIALFGACALFALSGRLYTSLTVVAALYGLIAAASWVKIDYLGNPLTLADVRFFLSSLSQNLVLFQAYPRLGLLLAASIAAAVAAVLLAFRYEARRALLPRGVAFGLAAAIFGVALLAKADAAKGNALDLPVFAQDPNAGNAFTQLWKFSVTGERRLADLIEIFFGDASIGFQLPPRQASGDFAPTAPGQSPGDLPDILTVLQESLFDPQILKDCAGVAECASPLFDKPITGEYGPMFAHSKAGGTWLSEFALLSGFDWRVFGPGGAHAPLNMAPHLRAPLAAHLRSLGYRTVAFYPVAGNFLNAREAYRHYGFDEFYAIEDLNISSNWQETSDANLFRKALEVIGKSRDGRPIFALILTIRNHGPHADKIEQIAAPIPPGLKSLPPPLVDYLLRMRDTETAMAALKRDWLGGGRPRLLAWFGDHQPLFPGAASLNRQRLGEIFSAVPSDEQIRFMTWYEISSNLPQHAASASLKPLDLAYLGTEILDYAGIPLPPHGKATLAMGAECPLGIALCDKKERIGRYLSFRVWDLGEIQ